MLYVFMLNAFYIYVHYVKAFMLNAFMHLC